MFLNQPGLEPAGGGDVLYLHLRTGGEGSGEGEDQGKDETDHWLISWDWDPACGGAAAGVGGEGWPSGAIR